MQLAHRWGDERAGRRVSELIEFFENTSSLWRRRLRGCSKSNSIMLDNREPPTYELYRKDSYAINLSVR